MMYIPTTQNVNVDLYSALHNRTVPLMPQRLRNHNLIKLCVTVGLQELKQH